ncbi:MAG: putative N-acetylmannosamine-6-phosphate 2-epimerase [Chthonomonas sp.]|nr:putative N-acetylmannosamine-6-phosphate 2-epimerase [Chthonomonas sp.]
MIPPLSPLVVSVQSSSDTLHDPAILLPLAQASLESGAEWLRLEGVATVSLIRGATGAPTIGLIKRAYEGSTIYITATAKEVQELIDTGCEVIALDGTARLRPAEDLKSLIALIHKAGRLAMADCDSLDSIQYSLAAGADWVSTTLSGYTEETQPSRPGPNLDVVRAARRLTTKPLLAEGRYAEAWQVQAARLAGANSVVIGGAINDPVKMTRVFAQATQTSTNEPVLAVDIGGTWMRFATWDGETLRHLERVPTPRRPDERVNLIASYAVRGEATRVGISTGGTVDPASGEIWEAKEEIIPGHQGLNFRLAHPHLHITTLNDGLATAWAHACLPEFAGKRVVTLALGTGVGCGIVDRGRILMGARGEYPRLNDLHPAGGETFEDLLGGVNLSREPTAEAKAKAQRAANEAIAMVRGLLHPDAIVICGGVGLADWLQVDAVRSPFGPDAGLMGAAQLVSCPPSTL